MSKASRERKAAAIAEVKTEEDDRGENASIPGLVDTSGNDAEAQTAEEAKKNAERGSEETSEAEVTEETSEG